jgi:hypothetical protein
VKCAVQLTNSTEQSTSRQVSSRSFNQEISHLLWNLKVQESLYWSLSWSCWVKSTPSILFKVHFNVVRVIYRVTFTTGGLLPISSSWRQAPWDSRPVMFFQLNTCGHNPYVTSSLTRGWVCRLQLLLTLASAVILMSWVPRDSWPRFTVSDSRLPQPGGPGPPICIPQEHGSPVILPDTGFPFHRLLRLAGLRWRYSTPSPHRSTFQYRLPINVYASLVVSSYHIFRLEFCIPASSFWRMLHALRTASCLIWSLLYYLLNSINYKAKHYAIFSTQLLLLPLEVRTFSDGFKHFLKFCNYSYITHGVNPSEPSGYYTYHQI